MLVRCNNHPSKTYSYSARPVGYPLTAAICGRCNKPGMLLLSEAEWKAYQAGQTVFPLNSNVMQVQAERFQAPASAR
jgi:hypothetical protein